MNKKQRDIAKKLLAGSIAIMILFGSIASLATDGNEIIDFQHDMEIELSSMQMDLEQEINLIHIKTYEKEGTTMIGLRKAMESLGIDVEWNKETKDIEIGDGPQWTFIRTGVNSYFRGRQAPFRLSHAPEVKNGVTYVPEDFFTKVFAVRIVKPTHGVIKEVIKDKENLSINLIKDKDYENSQDIVLHIGEDSFITDEVGNEVSLDYLKEGAKVSFILPDTMTMSLPPQGSASYVVVNNKIEITQETKKLDKINDRVRNFVKVYKENEDYKDLKLEREIGFLKDNILGISFNGSFKFNETNREIKRTLNFNMETGEEITYENFFKKDEDSQKKLKEILDKKAKEEGHLEFEAEGRWVCFKDDSVVVSYYALDDSNHKLIELVIPLVEVENLIK